MVALAAKTGHARAAGSFTQPFRVGRRTVLGSHRHRWGQFIQGPWLRSLQGLGHVAVEEVNTRWTFWLCCPDKATIFSSLRQLSLSPFLAALSLSASACAHAQGSQKPHLSRAQHMRHLVKRGAVKPSLGHRNAPRVKVLANKHKISSSAALNLGNRCKQSCSHDVDRSQSLKGYFFLLKSRSALDLNSTRGSL